jgi:hypothetical protein
MGTKRRVKHHRRRYRGGEEFIERPFNPPKGVNPSALPMLAKKHKAEEEKRYQEWKAKREVEAREDLKGREEDAKMASFYERQKQERGKELDDVRKSEQRLRILSATCPEALKISKIIGTDREKTKAYRQFARTNHPDKGGDKEVFQKVDGCYRASLEEVGGRRKTRRRRHTRRKR